MYGTANFLYDSVLAQFTWKCSLLSTSHWFDRTCWLIGNNSECTGCSRLFSPNFKHLACLLSLNLSKSKVCVLSFVGVSTNDKVPVDCSFSCYAFAAMTLLVSSVHLPARFPVTTCPLFVVPLWLCPLCFFCFPLLPIVSHGGFSLLTQLWPFPLITTLVVVAAVTCTSQY